MLDLALELVDLLVGDAEPALREVADDGNDAALGRAPAVDQLFEATAGALADEDVDRPLALEQQLNEIPPDEPGRTSYEVTHSLSSGVQE